MRKIYATGGWLHYPPLEFYYMQGEINVGAGAVCPPEDAEGG